MQNTTSCEHNNGIYHCETIHKTGNTDVYIDFTQIYHNQYRPEINYLSGNPYPNYVTAEDLENELASQYDKTPWSYEEIQTLISSLTKIKIILNALITAYNLTPEMKEQLASAAFQASDLIDKITDAGQVTNHLINQEWGFAGSQLATIVGGAVITAMLTRGGGSIILQRTMMLIAGMYLLPRIELFLDQQLEEFNYINFLEQINTRFKIPSIFIIPDDISNQILCSTIPPHKRDLYPHCMTPPIVLDLDGNGIEFITLSKSKVKFDVNNDKVQDKLSWPTKGNAVLFADWNGSGTIDTRAEFMFSLYSPKKTASDIEGLMTFDYQDDGIIDSSDPIYEKLYLWDDLNSDGISSSDEVDSLSLHGISLYLNQPSKESIKHKQVGENKIEHIFYFEAQENRSGALHLKEKNGHAYSILLKTKIN
ncbi:hypothetical protein [Rheinheimera sp.]|uniref:hypothetical protein n=1 Tax=Rheinheimera sp. TaxID=1869214 RepID=UPI00307CEFA3